MTSEKVDPFSPERKTADIDALWDRFRKEQPGKFIREWLEEAYELGYEHGCEVNY